MGTLIIMVIVEYFVMIAAIGIATWLVMRYRKKGAAALNELAGFRDLLHQYEDEKYKQAGLGKDKKETRKASRGKAKAVAE